MSIELASHNLKVQQLNYYTTMWYLSAREACLAKKKKKISQERIIEVRDQGFSIRFADGLTFVVIS